MKILILTQWCDPEPVFRGLLLARELAGRGYEVEVLTGFPNYPGGKLYPGYRIRPWMKEKIDGIPILRVALYPSHDTSGFRRMLNYLSFALSAAVLGTMLVKQPDVIYVYHPPGTIGFAAMVIGFLRRVPFVYDIQDLWPDTVAASGMMSNAMALKILNKCCMFVYRQASRIVVLSPGFKGKLVERNISPDKIDVIYNWCDENAFKIDSKSGIGLVDRHGRFSIFFAGTMGIAQGLDSVLEAARICQVETPAAEFIFIGGGVERGRLKELAEEMHLENVKFLPRRPMEEMGHILANADALLVHLKDDPLFSITIPSKTQAYLAMGKPILMAVRGDAADLIRAADAGVTCEPGNPRSIANAVKNLVATGDVRLSEMGQNGKIYYERELSAAAGVTKFEFILKTCMFS